MKLTYTDAVRNDRNVITISIPNNNVYAPSVMLRNLVYICSLVNLLRVCNGFQQEQKLCTAEPMFLISKDKSLSTGVYVKWIAVL